MGYQSPIELIVNAMNTQLEGDVLKAVQEIGILVEKDELTNALNYDRAQYQKGYTECQDELDALRRDFMDCRNELCLRCGKYTQAHRGACDGCRWKEVQQI